MPKYNTKFDLDLSDMELIEAALRDMQKKQAEDQDCARDVQELLGRLHNQKVFYRPQNGVYVGG